MIFCDNVRDPPPPLPPKVDGQKYSFDALVDVINGWKMHVKTGKKIIYSLKQT